MDLKKTIALVFTLMPVFAWAEPEASLCKRIIESGNKKSTSEFKTTLQLIEDTYQLAANPASIIHPAPHTLKTSDSNYRKWIHEFPKRNLVFSLTPPKEKRDRFKELALDKKLEEAEKEKKKEQEKLNELYETKTVESCENKMKENGFSETKYMQILQQINDLSIPKKTQEGKAAKAVFRSIKKNLHLNWEFISSSTIDDVSLALKDPSVANIVLISHAFSTGQLLDSMLNEYTARDFFNAFSPTLMSLSIYSCYSENSLKYYSILKNLEKNPSIHPERFTFHVQDVHTNLIAENPKTAPLVGAGTFIEKVDHFLFPRMKGSERLQNQDIPRQIITNETLNDCRLELKNFKLSQGSVRISLNNQMITSISDFKKNTTQSEFQFTFPCSYFNEKENFLFFAGARKFEDTLVEIDKEGVSLFSKTGEMEFSKKLESTYITSDGKTAFRSLIFR